MVKLLDEDITTREVLDWKGLHVFHFSGSSCSQKLRIFLAVKGIEWESHEIDLGAGENYEPWYLGINPRGLVPCLVVDGEVHIESNDIMTELERRFPEPRLIPEGFEDRMDELLHHEDDLHLDLRTITFRFTQPRGASPRSAETLAKYREGGSGTVLGKPDPNKAREIAFWEGAADNGLTDDRIRASAARFRAALDEMEGWLAERPYLMGDALSVLDIAWVVYVNRLVRCGYPLEQLHPRVAKWFWPLRQRPEFDREMPVPPEIQKVIEAHHADLAAKHATLADVAGLA